MNFTNKELLRSKIQSKLLKLNFPILIAILLRDYDSDTVKRTLKQIGKDMGATWLKYYTPPSNKICKIFKKNTIKTFGKLKMKCDVYNDGFSLIFYECPLCSKDIEIFSDVPYCVSISGFYEQFFNELAKTKDFWFNKIEGDTVKSISSGDEYCEHYFKKVD